MKFRNLRTGQVQHVPDGGMLHLLMAESDVFEEVTDEPRKRAGRKPNARKGSDGDGAAES